MKKIVLAVHLLLCGITCEAQGISVDLAAYRSLLMGPSHYGCTTAGCRTRVIEKQEADSLYGFLLALNSLISSSGSLQAVTDIGSTTDNTMQVIDGGLVTSHSHTGLVIANYPALSTRASLAYDGGDNLVKLKLYTPSTSYSSALKVPSLTANREVVFPDEGDGAGLRSGIVIHTTKDPITVKVGNDSASWNYNGFDVTASAGSYLYGRAGLFSSGEASGTAVNDLALYKNKLEYTYTNSVGPVTHVATLDFSRSGLSGTTTQDIKFTKRDTGTLATLGDISTATGTNIANSSLRWNGNYVQHVAKNRILFDSAKYVYVTDTTGDPVFGTSSSSERLFKVRHMSSFTNTPSISGGTGAGTSPTISISGTDLAGNITVSTGTSCATSSVVATITFSEAYASAPSCIILQPANEVTKALTPNAKIVYVNQSSVTTTTFDITSGSTALSDGIIYKWYYMVIQ